MLWIVPIYSVYSRPIILKVFSQQVLYISLEQNGTKSAEECLNITRREELQKENQEMSNPLPLMSKGEEKQKGAFKRQAKEVCCHQCQRGRLLEMFSLMAKEMEKVKT